MQFQLVLTNPLQSAAKWAFAFSLPKILEEESSV